MAQRHEYHGEARNKERAGGRGSRRRCGSAVLGRGEENLLANQLERLLLEGGDAVPRHDRPAAEDKRSQLLGAPVRGMWVRTSCFTSRASHHNWRYSWRDSSRVSPPTKEAVRRGGAVEAGQGVHAMATIRGGGLVHEHQRLEEARCAPVHCHGCAETPFAPLCAASRGAPDLPQRVARGEIAAGEEKEDGTALIDVILQPADVLFAQQRR